VVAANDAVNVLVDTEYEKKSESEDSVKYDNTATSQPNRIRRLKTPLILFV